eukprot:Pgem_evm1s16752
MSVSIRPYVNSDAEELQKVADFPEISKNLRFFPSPYTIDDAKEWISLATNTETYKGRTFAITCDGKIVGGIGLLPMPDCALTPEEIESVEEFGYWLTPFQWGKGVATKATALFVRHVRESKVRLRHDKCKNLIAFSSLENIPSKRVLEKSGFSKERELELI